MKIYVFDHFRRCDDFGNCVEVIKLRDMRYLKKKVNRKLLISINAEDNVSKDLIRYIK